MILFNKRIVLFGFLVLLNLPAIAQLSIDSIPLTDISKQSFETVEGDKITLSNMQKEGFFLFLLPKPGSTSKGKKIINIIRIWMKEITSENKQTFSLLIVEPYQTSFPFYSIQKSKLKREPYPVVIDKNGSIIQQFGISGGEPCIVIADKNLDIIGTSLVHTDPEEIEKNVEWIIDLLSIDQ
ncbi:hypothetical protein [Halalkalibaculum sp. DA384]|uniref:hypothetical protein n=1 Tax=Halalkalibaculum sp. DA384 TaxID=3373606 RepID=UPI003754D632